jgi:hypothetical protein
MKRKFTSNLMVHDLHGAEALGTPLRCLKYQHILLAFLLRSDVKTSEPSLSKNIELFSRLRTTVNDRLRSTLARGDLQCKFLGI